MSVILLQTIRNFRKQQDGALTAFGTADSAARKHLVDSWRNRAALGVTTSVDDVAAQVVYFCKTSTITGQSTTS